ncbi:hypothetical protein ELI15_14095 [Rhizobium ruizarguesonis]|uniref:DUF7693 family protein n=1 Tax=Rhizobium ruizarguesonis TaxID=2081791 RepID=UPI001030375C|nr:hypothetical protein [Rhizobium ruizarguesonis]TAW65421.1 hypothetical protein ELI15_14095 [Rhizobium ruizarguesonis]
MSYSADFLLDIADSVDCPRYDNALDFGNTPFAAKDGWTVVIFYDCGDLDYIAHIITPDGQEIDFWEWPESQDRDRLIAWRGRPTAEEIEWQVWYDGLSDDERAFEATLARIAMNEAMMAAHRAMREQQALIIKSMISRTVAFTQPGLTELIALLQPDRSKPQTPRDRVRAMKAHPRSVRGRA